jgi:hypothetical protein
MARWHVDLQEYNYEIQHVPGKANISADVLSWPSGVDQGEKDNQQIIILPSHHFVNVIRMEEEPSADQKKALMLLTHDHPTAGHPRRDETIRKAKKFRSWRGMNEWIANYIKGCAICQQNKILTHWKKMPLYQITTEREMLPFKQIAMDLITGLPKHKGKDAILTIVNHGCSRAVVFLPCVTTITGDTILTPFSLSPTTDTVVDCLPALFLAYCMIADSDDVVSMNDRVTPRLSASDLFTFPSHLRWWPILLWDTSKDLFLSTSVLLEQAYK